MTATPPPGWTATVEWGYRDRDGREHAAESAAEARLLGNQVGYMPLERQVMVGPWTVVPLPL